MTAGDQHDARLIVRNRDPLNLEFPFDHLDGWLTPNGLFYVRSHFPPPRIDPSSYRLSVEGAVARICQFSLAELAAMSSVTWAATLECAGNGRMFLHPRANGVQWELGAVGTAEWTGVPLSTLLQLAEVGADACEVVFEGLDRGTPKEEPVPPGETPYARSVHITKAADVLIAYAMNGQALPVEHGFPVRAIVGGHYGMASVKWLSCIRVVTAPFQGYWQTVDYAYWDEEHGNPVRHPLGPMAIKSSIARPRQGESIPAGVSSRICGAAWGGDAPVTRVELSTDGGGSWEPARFIDPPQSFVWRRWEIDWRVPEKKGRYVLKARAIDADGNIQPEAHDRRFGAYRIHHTLPVEIIVV